VSDREPTEPEALCPVILTGNVGTSVPTLPVELTPENPRERAALRSPTAHVPITPVSSIVTSGEEES
jgi:hypothetical protein